jgi:hypothetical protein
MSDSGVDTITATKLDAKRILSAVEEYKNAQSDVSIKRPIYSVAFHFCNEQPDHLFEDDANSFATIMRDAYGANSKVVKMHQHSLNQLFIWLPKYYLQVFDSIDKGEKDPIVIFYYAGHSTPSDELVLAGLNDEDNTVHVDFKKIRGILEGGLSDVGFTGLLLYVLDTCYAGSATRALGNFTINYLCATDRYNVSKSFSSIDEFELYGKGQFTEALVNILISASTLKEILSVSDIHELLVVEHNKENGKLKVLPQLKTERNGRHMKQFGLHPLSAKQDSIVRHEKTQIKMRLEIMVPENLSVEESEEFAKGIISGGGKLVDVYISKSTHFVFIVPISVVHALSVVAPSNIVRIDQEFKMQLQVHLFV